MAKGDNLTINSEYATAYEHAKRKEHLSKSRPQAVVLARWSVRPSLIAI